MKFLVTSVFYWAIIFFQPQEFKGKVVGVSDGDTITILRDNVSYKVRFNGIDCPEKSQDFGSVAKQYTSDAVYNKTIKVKLYEQDKYGRWIGDVFTEQGELLNLKLVEAGLAWHYKQYSKDPALAKAETEARTKKVGLWVQPDPTPPWEYRRR